MDLIKFEQQHIIPAGALEQDMLIFKLCNTEKKSLLVPEERNLISLLSAMSDFELKIDSIDWSFVVYPRTKEPVKLRKLLLGRKKYTALNKEKSYSFNTAEILNYLQTCVEKEYNYKRVGNPLRQKFRFFRFVQWNDNLFLCTEDYESLPLPIAFSLLS